ncbi:Disease resistance protein L6 [Linum perenne]
MIISFSSYSSIYLHYSAIQRGPDTRDSITNILYRFLAHSKIRTFRDDEELRKGEGIWSNLVKAIGQSKISILIFSPCYAESKWCLKELAEIVEHKKREKGHVILPIFYLVDPGDDAHMLKVLILGNCSKINKLPEFPESESLEILKIESFKNEKEELKIEKLWNLKVLGLNYCELGKIKGGTIGTMMKGLRELELFHTNFDYDSLRRTIADIEELPLLLILNVQSHHLLDVLVGIKLPKSLKKLSTSSDFANPEELKDLVEFTIFRYEVFLNFRGPETRDSITNILYRFLTRSKIHTFIDDDVLRKGGGIFPNLVKAIGQSKISITILSPRYAESKWCLKELVEIVEHKKREKGHIILPIFYMMDPRDVRHQTGLYEVAFTQHKRNGIDEETIQCWKAALTEEAHKLKVLVLEHCSKMSKLPEFPESGNLEILEIRWFKNKEEDLKIEKLQNLKVLRLNRSCEIGKIKGGTIGMMKGLRELNLSGISCDYNTFRQTIVDIQELSSLQILNVESPHLVDVLEGIKLPKSLKKLHTSSRFANVEELLDLEEFTIKGSPDTRSSITNILYRFLTRSKIRTFRDDDELRKGEGIWFNLVKAIGQSKISVTIFSPRYAESKWCLKELAEIVEHKK